MRLEALYGASSGFLVITPPTWLCVTDKDSRPDFDEIISDVTVSSGKYSCPICNDFSADSVRSVKGHISGSKDEKHDDLGWNYEEEIEATAENN
ncbi:hypothetical protein [Natronobacterium texcoconense]|uniref:Uncharacterized protein n=1 Tax=Natronobacterium texcoconense TaxID=1095778 RepID=A0A1H1J4P6_NATTX|nr:hypothetical protein [Natronobacterium texcoconense]SDR44921.1 hypothetical protein SAMN04489842_4130 [Natronobacterium texcoconense]